MVGIAKKKNALLIFNKETANLVPPSMFLTLGLAEGHNLRDGFGFMIPNEIQFFLIFLISNSVPSSMHCHTHYAQKSPSLVFPTGIICACYRPTPVSTTGGRAIASTNSPSNSRPTTRKRKIPLVFWVPKRKWNACGGLWNGKKRAWSRFPVCWTIKKATINNK